MRRLLFGLAVLSAGPPVRLTGAVSSGIPINEMTVAGVWWRRFMFG